MGIEVRQACSRKQQTRVSPRLFVGSGNAYDFITLFERVGSAENLRVQRRIMRTAQTVNEPENIFIFERLPDSGYRWCQLL
jgi:hypothetical protein